jgi:DNA-binding NtrC family response regulator
MQIGANRRQIGGRERMNAQILCIGGNARRWEHWQRNLQEDGYVVVHARDEQEAFALLRACPVGVVCIDSELMAEAGSSVIGAGLKEAHPHGPVVLVQTGKDLPEHFEEHVDVVIDQSTFAAVGPWLIDELREMKFPLFVEWFEAWKERSASNGG